MQTNTPYLDEYSKLGMTPEQAREVISLCVTFGVDAGQALMMLSQAMGQAANGFSGLSREADELNVLANLHRDNSPHVGREEHRLRSMRKSTGKPWDGRT